MEKIQTASCSKCGLEKPLTLEFFKMRNDTKIPSFRKQCNACLKIKNDSYYQNNKESILTKTYKKRKENPEWRNEVNRKYLSKKRKRNPLVKVRENLCRRINGMIHKGSKSKKTEEILGCSWDQLKKHLEDKFNSNMNWDNYGKYGWHIDHIKPISLANTEQEVYELSHYTNLQPLWWSDNIKKSNKY
jgi:hypothetical protein